MADSSIEWTEKTWNPTRGCVKISPGCKHCYAETFAERWRGVAGHAYEQGFDPRLVPSKLGEPLTIKKPSTFFVDSMSDLFLDAFPFSYIGAVYCVAAAREDHTFQILTKRPERRQAFYQWLVDRCADHGGCERDTLHHCGVEHLGHGAWERSFFDNYDVHRSGPGSVGGNFPLPNVWEGVSVEDRKYGVPRIDVLRDTPAAVRFLSIEPLLEDLGKLDLRFVDQVIVGAESGRGARPFNEDWVRSLRDQCEEQDVAFFYKQKLDAKGRKISLPMLDGVQHQGMPR